MKHKTMRGSKRRQGVNNICEEENMEVEIMRPCRLVKVV